MFILVPCLCRYCISQLFEIRKQKQNISILETFDWLTKITHVVHGGVYLKRPKQLFDISIFFIPLKWKFSTISLIYSLKKLRKN